MTSADVIRVAVELVVALGGGALLAKLLTVRQERALLAAQAGDTVATGQARIMDAAGRIVEQQAELVPGLMDRIGKLEAREESRQAEVAAVRARASDAEDRLTKVLEELAALTRELDLLYRFADDARRWMENALRVVVELGGDVPPPPPPPQRRLQPADPTGVVTA